MTQQYTPVAWQDETTSQQGTLINAERLNQMQTAHHYVDGFEEVDAVPTADPSVAYHKVVYCTADNTFYRWDGTAWTADIDDETKRLLEQEIARATAAESELRGQLEDEHDARVDAETAINDRITDEAAELAQRIATETSTRYTADTALGTRITNETSARETADTGLGNRITAEATARAEADTLLGGRIDTEQARAEAAEQANAQAIANTYTKAEIDTALGAKADVATTYTKTETDALLALKADQATTYTKAETDTMLAAKANASEVVTLGTAQTIPGEKQLLKAYTFKKFIQTFGGATAGYRKLWTFSARGTFDMAVCSTDGQYRAISSARYHVEFRAASFASSENKQTRIYTSATTAREMMVIGANINPAEGEGNFAVYGYTVASAQAEFLIDTNFAEGGGFKTNFAESNDSTVYSLDTIGAIVSVADPMNLSNALDGYLPMVRTTGNQTKSGTMTFLDAIYGRLIDPLYEEYSGSLPSGKYRIFARIPAANTNSMIVLDVMVSANGGNFGYGRMIIGNPTTTGWFCRWVLRKSGGFLSATSIQIAREVATGDLVILALNPTYTGLAISLVYSKAGSSIHGAVRVTKVTSSADYALDGTDTGLDNIVPGSDMA